MGRDSSTQNGWLAVIRLGKDTKDRMSGRRANSETFSPWACASVAGEEPQSAGIPSRSNRGASHPPKLSQRTACFGRPYRQSLAVNPYSDTSTKEGVIGDRNGSRLPIYASKV